MATDGEITRTLFAASIELCGRELGGGGAAAAGRGLHLPLHAAPVAGHPGPVRPLPLHPHQHPAGQRHGPRA